MKDLETKIIAHHVGGRGFNVAFTPPSHFRGDIIHVLYEADSECVDGMNRNSHMHQAHLLGEMFLLPYCLGRSNGKGRLNITANAHASSMLSPDPSFFNNYCELQIGPAVYDVTYDDMLEVVKTVDVDVHSLDQLYAENKLPVKALPDVLSIDTQGLERDIMQGSERVIRDGVLAIATEVEIVPMYQGQPLLGEMLQLMNTYGFHFAGFTNLHEISQYRAPIGLRGKAFPGFGDALFLRKIETLNSVGLSRSELFLKATKLAFVSVVFGHIEYALEALHLATSLRTEVQADLVKQLGTRTYFRFLQQIETVAGQVEQLYPPIFGIPSGARSNGLAYPASSWDDSYYEEAVGKCSKWAETPSLSVLSTPRPVTWVDRLFSHFNYLFIIGSAYSRVRIKDLVPSEPHKAAAKIIYHSITYARRRFPGFVHAASSLVTAARESSQSVIVASQVKEGYSSFESLLIHYGFEMVADIVREKRITAGLFMHSVTPLRRDRSHWKAPFNQP